MMPTEVLIGSMQLDFKMIIEERNERPPVAARDYDSLESWGKKGGRSIQKVGKNTAIVEWSIYGYEQVWVNKDYTKYRDRMVKILQDKYRAEDDEERDFSEYDADHVVACARLADFAGSWTVIYPVKKSWNRFFGAPEENSKFMIKEANFIDGLYYMTGFEALKLFVSDISRIIDVADEHFASENATSKSIIEEMDMLRHI